MTHNLRRVSALAVASSMALALAACGTTDDVKSTSQSSASTSVSEGSTLAQEATPTQASADEMPSVTGTGADTKLAFPDSEAPAGLQSYVVEEGTGRVVDKTDYVVANYVGQVWGNDTAFDSSFARGTASGFSLQQVIPGWTNGLSGLPVGTKVILSIPADLGYGPSGGNASAGIGPDDTIAFYVEIVDAFGMDQAGQSDAKPEADAAKLPVEIKGELGAPASITVVEGEKEPTDISTTVVARGAGDEVGKEGTVYVQYALTYWDNSASESTYGTSGPYAAILGNGSIFDSLVGIPIGSRVLIEAPADKGTSAPAFAVLIDILGAN